MAVAGQARAPAPILEINRQVVVNREVVGARAAATRTYHEPARDVPVYGETDVLVVGGGPAGSAAAVAAARMGASVMLVERYGYLGGLSTGGLVIWIDRMTDWEGCPVIAGFASEIFERLPADAIAGPPRREWGSRDPERAAYWGLRTAAFRDVVTWSPTIDPEWLKLVSLDMVSEAGVKLVLHSWAVAPIMEGHRLKGVIFESKQGRQAIFARAVVDATGDGDIYALAGAAYETGIEEGSIHHCMNVVWLCGGVDMPRWLKFRAEEPERVAELRQMGRETLGLFDKPVVSWRDDIAVFMGPRLAGYNALSVDDLTTVEIESRRWMRALFEFYRDHVPGFENAWIMQTAPQIGVRHSRRLQGIRPVLRSDWQSGLQHDDEIGVSPSLSPAFPSVSISYGSLLPIDIDGLLAPGRHMACDPQSHIFLREIPQCWMTGQAAGAAAALAAATTISPRQVDVPALQRALLRQNAYLRPPQADERKSSNE